MTNAIRRGICRNTVDLEKIEKEAQGEFMADDAKIEVHKRSIALRLFIKEIIMRHFRSYTSKQCIGPFHKSFSAVVGPNGSGKSNVIDAMLFVFGKPANCVDAIKQGFRAYPQLYQSPEFGKCSCLSPIPRDC